MCVDPCPCPVRVCERAIECASGFVACVSVYECECMCVRMSDKGRERKGERERENFNKEF